MKLRRWLYVAVLLGLIAIVATTPSVLHANAVNLYEAPSSDGFAADSPYIILSKVRLDYTEFDELVAVESHDAGYFIPVMPLARMLQIALKVNRNKSEITGFVFSEDDEVFLSLADGRWRHGKRTGEFDKALIIRRRDGLYLHVSLWEKILRLRTRVDLFAALIFVEPLERLPIQERLDRERRGLRLSGQTGNSYARQESGYHLLSLPALDQSLQTDIREDNALESPRQTFRYSTVLAADALYMDTQAVIIGNEQKPLEDYRFTMARRDPEPFLGPLAARSLLFGDIYLQGHRTLSQSRRVRGAEISNFSLDKSVTADRRTFQGVLQPGWEVELYRNDVLVAYQPTTGDLEYVFRDIEVYPGVNTFEFLFYGPQGQRRSQTITVNLAESRVGFGEFHYRVAAGLEDIGEPGFQQEDDTKPYSVADTQFGLGGPFWASLGGASLFANDKQAHYGIAGLRMLWRSLYAYGDILQQSGGGRAYHSGAQVGWRHLRLLGEHTELRDFESQEYLGGNDAIVRRSRASLDLMTTWPFGASLLHALERDETALGQVTLRPKQQVSLRVSRFTLTNTLSATYRPDLETPLTYVQGATYLSRRFGRVGVSGSFDYQIAPERRPVTAGLNLEFMPKEGYSITPGFSHAFLAKETALTLGLGKQIGSYAAGINLRATDQSEYYAGLQLSFGVHAPGTGRGVRFDARSVTRTGTAVPRVYVDKNMNGRRDPSEETVEGVRFHVNGSEQDVATDENGEAVLTSLAAYRYTDISIKLASLPDTAMRPVTDGARFVPRPGVETTLDIPVVYSGEIDGTLWDARRKKGIAGMELIVADGNGRAVKRVRTEYDGYYWVSDLHPGSYLIYPNPREARKLGYRGLRSKRVQIASNGSVFNAVDFALRRGTAKPKNRSPRHAKLTKIASTYLSKLNAEDTVTLDDIGFLPGTSIARGGAFGKLADVIALVKARPQMTFSLEVHADIKGTPEQAQLLSDQRAAALKRYLRSKGVQVTVKAMGNRKPVAFSFTFAGRERNNRIVLRLAGKA